MDANIVTEGVSSATSTPEADVVETVEESGAPKTDDTSVDAAQEDTAAAEATGEEDGGAEASPTEEPFSLSFKYRHEDVSVSKEEAIELMQLGKHYKDNQKEIFDGLDYLAAIRGKDAKEYIKELVDATDSLYRAELIQELGEDNPHIEELMELHKSKNLKNYEDIKKSRAEKEQQSFENAQKDANTKLAEQFENVKKVFPEYQNVSDIPDSVFKAAVKSGDLEKEVLRFHFAEQKKVEKAKEKQVENTKQSTGSISSSEKDHDDMNAFKKSFWS